MATLAKATNKGVKPLGGADKTFILSSGVIDLIGVANGDVVQALNVLAGTLVQNVFVEIVTAANGTATAKVGDGSDDDGFHTTTITDLAAAVGTITGNVASAAYTAKVGNYYSVNDTIDLTCAVNPTLTAGSVRVHAVCVDIAMV